MRYLLLLLSLLPLLGCGNVRPSKEAFAKIKLGMTEAQVEAELGRPASVFVLPEDKAMKNWTYSEKDWVNFNNGQVFAVVYDEKDMMQTVPLDEQSDYARAPLATPAPGVPATPVPGVAATPAASATP